MTKKFTTYTWAFLPFVFSSAAVLTSPSFAAPSASQQYQDGHYEDARQVSRANHEYVGGRTSIGGGITDDGDVDAEFNQVISEGQNHSTGVGLWAGYDLEGDDKGLLGRGVQMNHNWVSRDKFGNASHVNKVFAAYDKNEAGHDKATVGYGRENQNLFWDTHVSKGLSGRKDSRIIDGKTVSDRAYDYGVGGSIGKFIPDANVRVRAGLDHEWSDKVGTGEKDARNTTLSAGLEKFFQGTGHSVSVDVSGSKRSGGYNDGASSDADVSGRVGYRYDFGSAFRAESTTRRVRVEVPGKATPPRYEQRTQYKRVPTYKTVPVYGNKNVGTGKKRLVKSTMELEGQTFFKLNSSKLIPSAKTRLLQVAAEIRKTGYKGNIRITGNTCGLGDAVYDQILSEKRANSVKKFLIKNGFNPDHLVSRGLGKAHPKYPNVPGQGFKNRRVDIEYVTESQRYVEDKTAQQRVQTGTRQVVSGFKNVPNGTKNVMIDSGQPGTPRVIWKTETIKNSPAWITRALHNNIKHDRSVNTYQTTEGSTTTLSNQGPVATNDSTKVECGQSVAINVLANDTDANNDTLNVTSFTQPSNGTVSRGANNELIYTANGGGCGVDDQFTYTISDGNGGTDTATVTISVEADDKVVAANEVSATEEGEAVTIDVLSNDDADATITRIVAAAANGVVSIVNGKLVYTPNPGFYGTDKFTYEVKDPSGNVDTATVTVTVKKPENSAPIAVGETTPTQMGQAVTLNILDNDSDPENDTLTITNVSDPAHGSAVIRGGQIIYTPDAGYVGTDSFTYTISDGNGGTATATETITITGSTSPSNSSPVATDDNATTPVNQAVTLTTLSNDTDPDGDALTISNVSNPQNGTAVIRGGEIIYTPDTDFVGTETFTYTISDGNGNTATATETVIVTGPGNAIPNAVNDASKVACNGDVVINVLSNDTDTDGNTLSVSSFTQPANGSVTQGSNGTLIYTSNGAACDIDDKFTYTVSDGNGGSDTATVTVVVDPAANSAPVAVDDNKTTLQNTPVSFNSLTNDSDPENDTLTITAVGSPSHGSAEISGNQIIYTPDNGYVGQDSFSYTISDGKGNTATATETVTITAVVEPNKMPIAKDDSVTTNQDTPVTLNTLSNDSDPDGDTLTITSVGNPSNGKAVINGDKIVYTPEAGFVGEDSFTYFISDGKGGTATAIETITVKAVVAPNQTPVAVDDAVTTDQDTPVTLNTLSNDSDPDGDSLKITSIGNPSHGSASINGGKIVYTPDPGYVGTDSFSYEISDGKGGTATATETITIKAVVIPNKAPVAKDDSATTPEQTPVTLTTLSNDSDPDGDNLTITNVETPANGTATINGQTIVYTPKAGFSGTDKFEYTISDGNGGTATATETVIVTAVNKAPNASNDVATTGCSVITIDVLGNDTDPDGDTLKLVSVTGANLGTAVVSGNNIVYTPSNTCGKGNTGVDNLSYTISDGNGHTASAGVTVNVEGVTGTSSINAESDDVTTTKGTPITINALANDGGEGLKIIAVDSGSNGNAVVSGNKILYTPFADFTGTESIWYDIIDENGHNDSALIVIFVEEGCPTGTKCN
ncbi:Ig-like domain-containing protein [Cocleimonas sp. KMM 6892]|uniref:Ig-like domain-containing protein n=1 Tax=unclassified Cocleimonas TaxID=2639732 RepID=UPI002DB5850F|nr:MULTISPECIES: Ig-like domain-containing protein [unclassified Cocleimonas]MEB8432155.1 Ig-like domain-containing protein [Cocleimonas sp. KMM 6892]MEC4714759.1 Ig-like domain-containing protein [Cocleimonas sp. KMM 6895]MEC4744427.1 Ig-like domain-containing protein [Cocleimonas sp. KMM 6896]